MKTEHKNTFAALLRKFEQDPKNPETLYTLGKVIALSVLRKVIDPQGKAAMTNGKVSDSGQNPALLGLRRSIMEDMGNLSSLYAACEKATKAIKNKDGDPETITADSDANDLVDALIDDTLGDGLDLVHTAAAALLEQAEKHSASGAGWTERPFEHKVLSKKVFIREFDSMAWKTVETTPIQEVFKAVRREIQNSRAIQTDPRNGYAYLEETAVNSETGEREDYYVRLGKYADLGGYQTNKAFSLAGSPDGLETSCGGLYTVDPASVKSYHDIINALKLSPKQAEYLEFRMKGYGYKAIATRFGVKQAAVAIQMYRVREKAVKIGFVPVETPETIAETLVSMLFRALED